MRICSSVNSVSQVEDASLLEKGKGREKVSSTWNQEADFDSWETGNSCLLKRDLASLFLTVLTAVIQCFGIIIQAWPFESLYQTT